MLTEVSLTQKQSKYSTVVDVMEIAPTLSVIADFEMKDIIFNLVILEDELKDGRKVKRAFATNEEYDENDVNLVERLFDLYGRRWGVETSYRIEKIHIFQRQHQRIT